MYEAQERKQSDRSAQAKDEGTESELFCNIENERDLPVANINRTSAQEEETRLAQSVFGYDTRFRFRENMQVRALKKTATYNCGGGD